MRVLVIDQFAELGGAQQCLIEAAEGMATRGWELHAAVPGDPLGARLRPFCASVSLISCGPYQSVRKTIFDAARFASQLRSQAATLGRLIEKHQIDVLYVNGPRVLPAASWARKARPVVFHSHSVVTQSSAARLAGQALRWADATVLSSSQFVAAPLTPFVGEGRLSVIYNGIRSFGGPPQARSTYTRIGMLGRIAPEKGQLTFVRAARLSAASDLTFVVAGAPSVGSKGYASQVRGEAGPNVEFSGWTEDVKEFFHQIDLLVVPSDAVDNTPRVIPEAYAAGIPVLAFRSGGIPELVEHNETGILVDERSPAALAAALLDATNYPAALDRLARNGYQRWKERYTLAGFQSGVCSVLERVAAQRAPLHRAPASARV